MSKLKMGPAMKKVVSGPEPETMQEALDNAADLVAEAKKGNAAYDAAVNSGDPAGVIETIREYATDIDKTKQDIRTINDSIKQEKENVNQFDEFTKAQEAYTIAKEELRLALQSNGHYNGLMETKAELEHKLKDQKDILSLHIVEFYTSTHERQVEMNPLTGDAQDILVTGKLGKKGKLQTSLFAGRD